MGNEMSTTIAINIPLHAAVTLFQAADDSIASLKDDSTRQAFETVLKAVKESQDLASLAPRDTSASLPSLTSPSPGMAQSITSGVKLGRDTSLTSPSAQITEDFVIKVAVYDLRVTEQCQKSFLVQTNSQRTIRQLCESVAAQENVPVEDQRLIFDGRELFLESKLEEV